MNVRSFRSTRRALLGALPALCVAPVATLAQGYPDKPITLVVPFPPGAVTDRVGRALAVELGKRLGQQVIVENIAGASGTLAGQRVLRAAPDGHTLLVGTVNDMMLGPLVIKKAGYSVRDFTPIAKLFEAPTVLVAHPSFPANSADELVAYAKKQSEPLPLGATGVAMMQTFGGVMFANAAGFKFSVVPYKGGGPLMTDLIGGQVQVATIALPSALSLIRQGKLKSLGIISTRRDPTAPELATINEGKAVKGIEADLWGGLAGPPNMPAPVVARLSAVLRDILADRAFKESEARSGNVLAEYADPSAFRQFLAREEGRLRDLAAGVTVE